MTKAFYILALLLAPFAGATVRGCEESAPAAIDCAFNRMYNFDFPGAFSTLDKLEHKDPSYPITYSVRAAAMLFSELYRLRILEMEFFSSDEKVIGTRLKADPLVRAALFKATGETRRIAGGRLVSEPGDRDAMFAMCMATGIESDYTILVEKRYIRSFSLSKQSQMYARQLLTLDPPVYDAYLTLGSVEYVVGSMNFFFRLFVHFDQVKGSKQQGVENLKKVVEHGRYYPPFAKILLSVIYLRENQPKLALPLLAELEQAYPENPLIRSEVVRVNHLLERPVNGGRTERR
jgi:hypothetical protein